jgi:hypothetical protein
MVPNVPKNVEIPCIHHGFLREYHAIPRVPGQGLELVRTAAWNEENMVNLTHEP